MIVQRLKSKTYWLGASVIALGFIQGNLHHLEEILGKWYGPVLMLIGVLVIFLRELTTKPLAEK